MWKNVGSFWSTRRISVYLQGVSFWAAQGRKFGIVDQEIDQWAPRAFFSTLTNVNFDPERIIELANLAATYKARLQEQVQAASLVQGIAIDELSPAAQFDLPTTKQALLEFAPTAAVNRGHDSLHEDVIGLRLLCLYGLKGAAAYLEHARVLSQKMKRSMVNITKLWLG